MDVVWARCPARIADPIDLEQLAARILAVFRNTVRKPVTVLTSSSPALAM